MSEMTTPQLRTKGDPKHSTTTCIARQLQAGVFRSVSPRRRLCLSISIYLSIYLHVYLYIYRRRGETRVAKTIMGVSFWVEDLVRNPTPGRGETRVANTMKPRPTYSGDPNGRNTCIHTLGLRDSLASPRRRPFVAMCHHCS